MSTRTRAPHVIDVQRPDPPPAVQPVVDPRAAQLALARTAYNYMRTYPGLEAVPLCASLPPAEQLSTAYNALVLRSAAQIAENFLVNARRLLVEEIDDDVWNSPLSLVQDLSTAWNGLLAVGAEGLVGGPTAFLKSTLFDLMRRHAPGDESPDPLFADDPSEYLKLLELLPKPLMLRPQATSPMPLRPVGAPEDPRPIAPAGVPQGDVPCEHDWFFGYLQIAGFNTTNLRGVVHGPSSTAAVSLDALRDKIAISDATLQSVTGDSTLTLDEAVSAGRLYCVDYTSLVDAKDPSGADSWMHRLRRYMPCPVAVFYWNSNRPAGFPLDPAGVLQPIAIKLELDPTAATFTPNNFGDGADPNGAKWKIAKYFVNVACAIQHETVAHLGDCHFIMDAVAVATHRQLPSAHSIFQLLEPHLRFTLALNNGALNNLVIPGGVVATNVGPDIHWSLKLVNDARKAWRWDQNHPKNVFTWRGVDTSRSLVFPFRDDTLLLWDAIVDFVTTYVNLAFASDADMLADPYLAAWFDELTSPDHADLQGLEKPSTRGDLAVIVAQMIYTAGPLHASVNYAQYPLGAYIPVVSATIYGPPPKREVPIDPTTVVDWYAPLDIALYTISFQYLLSSIQYDRFGHYSENPQFDYFAKGEMQRALEDFQDALARAEATIHARNRKRVMPYPFQLPSKIPNSVSI